MNGPQDAWPDRRQAWASYWGQGPLHSLSTSYEGNYQGSVARFWTSLCAGLGHSSRLLDIGTGNGSLPFLFNDMLGTHSPRIDAVDLADVLSPSWHQALPQETRDRIVFHTDTRAEHLPFEDGCFDLACSQYGIEYSDLPVALAEAARVLRAQGRLALVMHHAESTLARVASDELKWSHWLSGEAGFLNQARRLYPWLAMAAAGRQSELANNQSANDARAAFNQAQADVGKAIASSNAPDLLHDARDVVASHIDAILSGRASGAQAVEASLDWQQALRLGAFRQHELIKHALDQQAFEEVRAQLERMGFTIDLAQPLIDEGDVLMGWSLVATRN